MAKIKYRVSGGSTVFGHPPGSVFEADLSEEQEAQLVEGGAIEKARADAKVGDAEPNEGGEVTNA